MEDLVITFENENQKTRLCLNIELRMIEEETLYLQEDRKISKSSLQRDFYSEDTTLECLKMIFNSQLNTLTQFYQTKGKFEIKLLKL